MAKTRAVWGIDIGQCALKALRCNIDETGKVVADAYDHIAYPKILSQQDADPVELVKEALEQFLSRNELRGDKVAISVSGQAGLSRFFKPPPVDAKTLPEIVRYEAKQQIPFPLEDVIWDFQQIGGTVIDGLTIDAEVGLFAMKRDAVFRALQPFTDAEVEVDFVQLSPLASYNFVCHDILTDVPDPDEIDPMNPPPSLVVLAIGTDTTDLVVTDGIKLWMRNIPIGGNHFTKQLSRDLKLTYAKAEHLKRNARQAEDPKTIFQAMRPVFGDLVTEIQRSISFFQGIEKNAKIGKIAMLGNASKLPGLRQYLNKHMDVEIVKLNEFPLLGGDDVISQPTFTDNILSYNVCYGLCLQGLEKSRLKTNLLPNEFVVERLIRSKKPWALAALGSLMAAFAIALLFLAIGYKKVHPDRVVNNKSWKIAESQVKAVKQKSDGYVQDHEADKGKLKQVKALAEEVQGTTFGRQLWPELLTAIAQTTPVDKRIKPGEIVDPEVLEFDEREMVYVDSIESSYFDDISKWYTPTKNRYEDEYGKVTEIQKELAKQLAAAKAAAEASKPPGAEGADDKKGPADGKAPADATAAADGKAPADATAATGAAGAGGDAAADGAPKAVAPPTGAAWVIEIQAFHLHNNLLKARERAKQYPIRERFVREKWIVKMLEGRVRLPGSPKPVRLKDLGIDYIFLLGGQAFEGYQVLNPMHPENKGTAVTQIASSEDPEAGGDTKSGEAEKTEEEEMKKFYTVNRYDFTIQFVWDEQKRLKVLEKIAKGEPLDEDKSVESSPAQ